MFGFIKDKLRAIYTSFTHKLDALFGRTTIDEATLKELELLLISADTGVKTTRTIITNLKEQVASGAIKEGATLRAALAPILEDILALPPLSLTDKQVFLLVGINGSGKTTFASKLAYKYMNENKKVLLVAADTFRAAATEQLAQWAYQTNAHIVTGIPGQDPSAVVFKGCEEFSRGDYNILIIDTAGRLQTKTNLMAELAKIKRVVSRQLVDQEIITLLTVDAMLGQNSFEQAKLFKECTNVNGIALTKMDGTGKGGIIFAIAEQLAIPIVFITYGEKPDHLKVFNAHDYVQELVNA